jgi:hypothetical protein
MLDAYIIDELKRREQREQEDEQRPRPVLELPLDDGRDEPVREDDEDAPERGVIIIDM